MHYVVAPTQGLLRDRKRWKTGVTMGKKWTVLIPWGGIAFSMHSCTAYHVTWFGQRQSVTWSGSCRLMATVLCACCMKEFTCGSQERFDLPACQVSVCLTVYLSVHLFLSLRICQLFLYLPVYQIIIWSVNVWLYLCQSDLCLHENYCMSWRTSFIHTQAGITIILIRLEIIFFFNLHRFLCVSGLKRGEKNNINEYHKRMRHDVLELVNTRLKKGRS